MLGIISVTFLVVCLSVLTFSSGKRGPKPRAADLFFACLYATPGILAIVIKRAPPILPNHCKTCGYNLTGNVSGKCSECGTAISNSD